MFSGKKSSKHFQRSYLLLAYAKQEMKTTLRRYLNKEDMEIHLESTANAFAIQFSLP